LNYVSATLFRFSETSKKLEALNNKLVEKEACITELKEQLESAEARASAAVARVKKVEESVAGQQANALRDSEMHITQKDELI
jgi:chromosome segregation ATPase